MAGNLFQFPKAIAWDAGAVQAGAKLTFTATGTTNAQNTYTDLALSVASSNPVVADSEGVFAPIYLDPILPDYRVKYTDSADTLIYQVDDVPASQSGSSLTLTGAAPFLNLIENDASANNTVWRLNVNSEQLALQVGNDALSAFVDIFTVDRTANTVDTVNFKPTTLQHNGIQIITQTELDALEDKNRIDVGGGNTFNSDTTLANVTTAITLDAATHYAISGIIYATEDGGGLKFKLTFSQTPSETGYFYHKAIDETGTEEENFQTDADSTISLTAMTNGEDFIVKYEAMIKTHATLSSTVILQAAQVASSANSTITRQGTWIAVKKNNV